MASDDVPVRPPVPVVRPVAAAAVPDERWPAGGATQYTAKLDGWRAVGAVLEDHRAVLVSREGGRLEGYFPDVVEALAVLPVGTVVDGEICAILEDEHGSRVDFDALARRRGRDRRRWPPVVFALFDALATTRRDLRRTPLEERLDVLTDLLPAPPSVLQPVPSTTSREQAVDRWMTNRAPGVEGIVARGMSTLYLPPRTRWVKVRTTDTLDAVVIAVSGPPDRPAYALVRLPDGTEARTSQIPSPHRTVLGRATAGLLGPPAAGGWRPLTAPVVAEVQLGTTRHRTLRYVRLRPDLTPPPP
ncbi:hypothetical protein ACFQ7N_10170 [Streptomyces niveus]|uniref:ATP-dependent DNA ligase n=1 Tax=Streptomyces niveus TaxID=193462 RepID=UPI0036773DEF